MSIKVQYLKYLSTLAKGGIECLGFCVTCKGINPNKKETILKMQKDQLGIYRIKYISPGYMFQGHAQYQEAKKNVTK